MAAYSPWSGWYLCLHSRLEPGATCRHCSPHIHPKPPPPSRNSEQRLLLCSLHTFLGETLISALPYLGWRIVLREFPGKDAAAGTEVMEA